MAIPGPSFPVLSVLPVPVAFVLPTGDIHVAALARRRALIVLAAQIAGSISAI
jgi:hypothetical protein